MTQRVSSEAAAPSSSLIPTADRASSFTPAQIRQAIAYWVGQDRIDMAQALVAAGLSLYPDSPDVLVIAALVAEMGQDWVVAQDCLETLLDQQGEAATGEVFHHLVRVMRCRASFHQALGMARRGLQKHPEHSGLAQECAQLEALLVAVPVSLSPTAQAA